MPVFCKQAIESSKVFAPTPSYTTVTPFPLVKSLTLEVIEEDELDEITVTNDVEGYNTQFFLQC